MNGFFTATVSAEKEKLRNFLYGNGYTCLSKPQTGISMFHRVFFNSIIDKTPTHALFIQHYISLAC